jgi:hypothetical protein
MYGVCVYVCGCARVCVCVRFWATLNALSEWFGTSLQNPPMCARRCNWQDLFTEGEMKGLVQLLYTCVLMQDVAIGKSCIQKVG